MPDSELCLTTLVFLGRLWELVSARNTNPAQQDFEMFKSLVYELYIVGCGDVLD